MIVTGTIIEKSTSEAMPYANVYISDASGNSLHKFNTNTDENGKYSINAEAGDYLSASFVGYKPQTAKVTGSKMDFVMSDVTAEEIKDVTVQAKKTITRAQIFGAIFIILGIGYIFSDSRTTKT